MKSRDGKSQRREEKKREDEKRASQKKEDPRAWKGRNVAKHCVFPRICGPGRSKRRLAKAAGAEPAGQLRHEKLLAVVARSTFYKSKCKPHHVQSTFGRWDVQKVHVVVVRSTSSSQNAQSTHGQSTFGGWDVQKVHAVLARSTFRRIGTRPSALHSTVHFWGKSCRIVSFDVVYFKNWEVSQNCFVFDVVNYKHWGSPADLFRFRRHQWIRPAIRDSQQPTFPMGFLFLKLPPPPALEMWDWMREGTPGRKQRTWKKFHDGDESTWSN